MPVQWAATTHPGIRRTSNEDSYCSRPDLGLFIVADGMGGHVAGEVASRIAVDAIEAFIGETASDDSQITWPQPVDPALGVDGSRLKSAFHLANRRLADEVAAAVDLRGMATTASTVLLKDDRKAMLAHVGDSRIYLFRDNELERMTDDHSWVEEQMRAGLLSPIEARQHPWRNVVTRALSGGEDPEVDVKEVSAPAGRSPAALLGRPVVGGPRRSHRGNPAGPARADRGVPGARRRGERRRRPRQRHDAHPADRCSITSGSSCATAG